IGVSGRYGVEARIEVVDERAVGVLNGDEATEIVVEPPHDALRRILRDVRQRVFREPPEHIVLILSEDCCTKAGFHCSNRSSERIVELLRDASPFEGRDDTQGRPTLDLTEDGLRQLTLVRERPFGRGRTDLL